MDLRPQYGLQQIGGELGEADRIGAKLMQEAAAAVTVDRDHFECGKAAKQRQELLCYPWLIRLYNHCLGVAQADLESKVFVLADLARHDDIWRLSDRCRNDA
jgi:hypothetical protein